MNSRQPSQPAESQRTPAVELEDEHVDPDGAPAAQLEGGQGELEGTDPRMGKLPREEAEGPRTGEEVDFEGTTSKQGRDVQEKRHASVRMTFVAWAVGAGIAGFVSAFLINGNTSLMAWIPLAIGILGLIAIATAKGTEDTPVHAKWEDRGLYVTLFAFGMSIAVAFLAG